MRSKSHLGAGEDLIAHTWAAPDFDDGSADEVNADGKRRVGAWREGVVGEGGVSGGGQRPRSAGSEAGYVIQPLLLDSMADPSGLSRCGAVWRSVVQCGAM